MSEAIAGRLRQVAARVEADDQGRPRAIPTDTAEVAAVVGLAHQEGWSIRVEGAGLWCPADAPADLALSTTGLRRVHQVAPADLVATVDAGLGVADLDRALEPHRVRLALDPPGSPERTLGSVLATATVGSECAGSGPVRDQLLGVTIVTGDGRVIRAGGTVVKNVAGYDLCKLAVGSFGGFGIITETNLRLRARPACQVTVLVLGEMNRLIDVSAAILQSGIEPAALELASPGLTGSPDWTLSIRLAGIAEAVAAAAARVASTLSGLTWHQLDEAGGAQVSQGLRQGALNGDVTLRFGALPKAIPELLDRLEASLGAGSLSAGLSRGGVRWTGAATIETIAELRHELAGLEIPVTLERAPWPIRSGVGHFGAYREGVGRLTAKLRAVFDPGRILVAPLEGVDG